MRLAGLWCVVVLGGCAMSQRRYEGLVTEFAERERLSQTAALKAFFARERLTYGYGPNWVATLSLDCDPSHLRSMPKDIDLSRQGNGTIEHLVFAEGGLASLCDDPHAVVEGTLDGRPVKARLGLRVLYARDAGGQLVSYALAPQVVRKEKVLVSQSCDHMPHDNPPEPRTVEVTLTIEEPARHYEVSYDAYELDVSCTSNTY